MTSDEFGSTTENEALKAAIRDRIRESEQITFCEFMELALYHPLHGYYATPGPKMGRQGDYLTSPEVHPIFGAMIGRQLLEMWQVMGCPQPFDVVETGAGSGVLCRDILRWAHARQVSFYEALRYHVVEISHELIAAQKRTVRAVDLYLKRVSWWDPGAALPADSFVGCFLSNELVDSFPVHRLVVEDGLLKEVYVTCNAAGELVEVTAQPSTPALADYFAYVGVTPPAGCHLEVNLRALTWLAEVAQSLRRGFVLTLDYGYPAAELYAPWRRDGTLLCFYRHNPSTDPYARLGCQDMTSHVDFTALIKRGQELGLETLGLTTQSRFLAALGIGDALDRSSLPDPRALEEYYARRRAVTELLDPAGLGRIRVLVQARDVGTCKLRGLEPGPT